MWDSSFCAGGTRKRYVPAVDHSLDQDHDDVVGGIAQAPRAQKLEADPRSVASLSSKKFLDGVEGGVGRQLQHVRLGFTSLAKGRDGDSMFSKPHAEGVPALGPS